MKGNLLVAQGGGPTAVINASLMGVITEAKRYSEIKKIYGARYGNEGLIQGHFYELQHEKLHVIENLMYTPGAALGSCRKLLSEENYERIIEFFRRFDIRYFLYIGGNGTMGVCLKIAKLTERFGIKVIGIPKTVDNDLVGTDHCPGFASAARYAALSTLELAQDVKSLPIHVCILELMGRNTGWIAASSTLAKKGEYEGPHLVYTPERPFVSDSFLGDVEKWHIKVGGVVVVVSEGIRNIHGELLTSRSLKDPSGKTILGGIGHYLSSLIINNLKVNARFETPGILGRASIALQSTIDREEAIRVGRYGVQSALKGKSGYMVSIQRISSVPYYSELQLVPLEKVANQERILPDSFINKDGNGINEQFKEYCVPLIGSTIPEYPVFTHITTNPLEMLKECN